MNTALWSLDGVQVIFRWFHVLCGVTWIGLLYYFNFIQGTFFKETDEKTKKSATLLLVPRALWWFRWSALFTFLTGVGILGTKGHQAGWGVFDTSWGLIILTGATLGTLMFLNVWLIIWPNQQIVIAAAKGEKVQGAPKAAAAALLASRTNTLFSIPMILMMVAAANYPLSIALDYSGWTLFIPLALVIGGIEANAIWGKLGPMKSVVGVIHAGLGLTVLLFVLLEALT